MLQNLRVYLDNTDFHSTALGSPLLSLPHSQIRQILELGYHKFCFWYFYNLIDNCSMMSSQSRIHLLEVWVCNQNALKVSLCFIFVTFQSHRQIVRFHCHGILHTPEIYRPCMRLYRDCHQPCVQSHCRSNSGRNMWQQRCSLKSYNIQCSSMESLVHNDHPAPILLVS